MKEVGLPPRAAALSESMRDLGYTLEAAVADIVDNSISAKAAKVDIFFDFKESGPTLAILDDGGGMSQNVLIEAMRHGTTNPRETRSADDLGRFGLGLKTASFSQCTRLTVASTQNGLIAAAMWDLELVADRDDWIICVLDDHEIQTLPYVDRLADNGTMVLWEKLDRLCESDTGTVNEKLIHEKIREVEKHLSLVFHRFMSGEIKRKKLKIAINYHDLEPFDPFCTANKATQLLNQEIIRMRDAEVVIQPYILPHHSKLSPKEQDYYNNRSDFLNNQGAYVYRNGRLMAWGDWFRLIPKGESTKLARVRIDFPNSLDEHWTIDIKKSRAHPPYIVRERIRKVINKISEGSTRVIKGKGKRLYDSIPKPVWLRTASKGAVEYSLDRNHPVINAFSKSLGDVTERKINEIFSLIETSVPIERIYADYSINPQDFEFKVDLNIEEICGRLDEIWEIMFLNQDISEQIFRDVVSFMKPFSEYPDVVEKFIWGKINERSKC